MLKTLLKIRLKAYFSSLFRGRANKTRGAGFKVLMGLLAVYVIACFFGLFGSMFSSLCVPLHDAGLTWFYFAMSAILSVALAFVGGVFTAQSQIYEARDNDLLLSMPIRPSTILASRMGILLITEYAFELLIAIPAGVVYCMHYPVSAGGVVLYVVCCLFAPLIAVAVSCLVGWLVALISSKLPNKTLASTVFSLIFLAAYFIVYFNAQKYLQAIIANGTEAAAAVKRALYIFYCFGEAIAGRDILCFVIFIAVCAALFAIVYIILTRSFIKLATAQKSARRKKRARGEMSVNGVRAALLKKELKRFSSSPAYMLNGGFGVLIAVVGAVVLVIKRGAVLEFFAQVPMFADFMPVMASGAVFVLASMVGISSPSLSLEGKCLWIPKTLPVPSGLVLLAKADAHIVITLPAMLLLSLACIFCLGLDALSSVFLLLSSSMFVVLTAFIGVAINLRMPSFDWVNETVCVKQSGSVIITMLVCWAVLIAIALIYVFLLARLLTPVVFLVVLTAVLLIVNILLRHSLLKRGARKFEEL